ncbi:MAG: hypothetical protein KF758_08415 [Anaerolineales bacterium]|nr:hypothetical protein [Anaerolineales bacterium]MBX3036922.1 hypothetical protein [Anaerolineales bacterium]
MSNFIFFPQHHLRNMNRAGINPRASLQSPLKRAEPSLDGFVKIAWTFTSMRVAT